tara:strand:- start:718 stop:981 length:264 start_codon:yes stop_codon:yes gene_type:complete
MFALLKQIKGQRSNNIAVTLAKVIEIVGQRTNKAAYDALGKIEAAARKQRRGVEDRAIEQGLLIKTVSSVSQIPATERNNYKREWVA